MKINTFPFVIIFSILISFSVQINENQKYKKFLSNIVDNGTPEQNQIINQEDPVKRDEPVYDEDYDYDDEDGNFGYGYKGIFAESQNETDTESNTTDTPATDKIDNGILGLAIFDNKTYRKRILESIILQPFFTFFFFLFC